MEGGLDWMGVGLDEGVSVRDWISSLLSPYKILISIFRSKCPSRCNTHYALFSYRTSKGTCRACTQYIKKN